MATSTIVQLLQAGEAGDTSNRRQIETFIAGGTIAAGDCVGFDTTKTGADRALFVTEAGTVAIGNALAIGVALNAATADQQVRCVVAGYAENVKCGAGVAAGDPLSVGQAATGTVDTRVAADTAQTFGVALEAVAANTVDIIVFKQF